MIHIVHHNWIFAELWNRANALFDSILSLVLNLFTNNGTPQIEENKYARYRSFNAHAKELGITYGRNPKNIQKRMDLIRGGDGVIVVRKTALFGRVTAPVVMKNNFSSKAGGDTLRGSETKIKSPINSIGIKNISNLKNLVAAYELIKSNPGNMTPGATLETLDGVTIDYLLRVQKELRSGKFKFGPARRIQIPKPGKTSMRPLSMASPREKIVQKAIQLVMEP